MTSHGQPDEPRSARYILKDYVNVSPGTCTIMLHMHNNAAGEAVVLPRPSECGWTRVQHAALARGHGRRDIKGGGALCSHQQGGRSYKKSLSWGV